MNMKIDARRVDFSKAEGRAKRVHKLVNTFNLGYGTGSPLPGASNAPQGMCHLVVSGQRKAFATVVTTGSAFGTDERVRIFEFNLSDDGSAITPVAYSLELNIGHGQDLAGEIVGGNVVLWTTSQTTVGGTGAGKGFSRIEWKGASTAQADVTTYLVCGASGSGHRREGFYQGTVSLSQDGANLILVADSSLLSQERMWMSFDKAAVMAAGGSSLNVDPVQTLIIAHPNCENGRILQGAASANGIKYTLSGYRNALGITTIQMRNDGTNDLIDEFQICPEQERIGLSELRNSATYTSHWIEPEGIDIYGDEILVQYLVLAHTGGDIVSSGGKNYAFIGATPEAGRYPYDADYFQETDKAATAGAWNIGTSYTRGTAAVHIKSLWSVRPPRGVAGETVISPLKFGINPGAPAVLSNTVWQTLQRGVLSFITKFSESVRQHMKLLGFAENGLRLHDARIGSDNEKSGGIAVEFDGTNELLLLRARATGLSDGAGINIYGKASGTNAGQLRFYAVDTDGTLRTIYFRPGASATALYGNPSELALGLLTNPLRDVVSNKLSLVDGVTAPSTIAGQAQIYVDAADGDLKIKFGDGVTKTIVIDT